MDNASEDDDDEQLKLAIALSLQEEETEARATAITTQDAISISDDEESVSDAQKASNLGAALLAAQDLTWRETKAIGDSPLVTSNGAPGLLGLDRKAMEAERLARKRKAPISPPPLSKAASDKRTRIDINGLNRMSESVSEGQGKGSVVETTQSTNRTTTNIKLQFPAGVVKKTWSFGFPRQDDVKLEEVLQKADLQLAVLSSFQWDIEWLFRKIDMKATKLILVMQAKEEATRRQYLEETASMTNVRLCFPSMAGIVNCMHSKLMLLSHPSYLRVVIPTSNLVSYDWGELGVLENSVFMIDLPRLQEGTTVKEDDLTFFGKELIYFCKAMGLQQDVTQSLHKFDFSATKDMAFVHTIGGEHSGPDEPWRRTGHCGLGRAISHLGLNTQKAIQVDFIASSLGAITTYFITTLYLVAQGDDGTTELEWRLGNSKSKTKPQISAQALASQQELTDTAVKNFRLYFPSRSTVLRSRGGVDAGGPICFQQRWYESPKFPKEILRDCKSVREGLLMHNKVSACILPPLNVQPIDTKPPSLDPLRPTRYHFFFLLLLLLHHPILPTPLGLHRLSKLLRERLGQALPQQGDEAARAELSKLGVWGCVAYAAGGDSG